MPHRTGNETCPGAGWVHFSHAADMGVRGRGPTPASAFEQAAEAMTAVITDPGKVRATQAVPLSCRAPDLELLLVDWLNALVFEMATRNMLFSRFDVAIHDGQLEATAWGEPVDRARHQPAVEVKGATFTALSVIQDEKGWQAGCVIDV